MAAPTVLIRNIHHGVCKDEEAKGRRGRRAGRAVVRKVGAYELCEGRESAGNVEDRMIRREKGRRRRSVSHLSSVVAEKDSDSDGERERERERWGGVAVG